MMAPAVQGPLRIFLCHSSADPFVPELMTRLEAQGFAVWDYQRPDDRIPSTARIDEACIAQIRQSNMFLPVLTPSFLVSRWTAVEVECALERAGEGPIAIFPLIGKQTRDAGPWPAPFQRLAQFLGSDVDFGSRASIEAAIVEICRHAGVEYRPPRSDDRRLPFLPRFFEEIVAIRATSQHGAEIYRRLLHLALQVLDDFAADAYDRAAERMDYFIQIAEYEYTSGRLCYPYIVRAVCDAIRGRYEEALDRLTALRDAAGDLAQRPERAVTIAATIGYVHFHQGRFEAAVRCYEEALRFVPDDPADLCNLALARIYAGQVVDLDEAFALVDRYAKGRDDTADIDLTKAEACARANRHPEAERRFRALLDRGHGKPEHVVAFAQFLVGRERAADAIQLLEDAVRTHPDEGDPRFLLARLLLLDKKRPRADALAHFRELRDRRPRDWMMQLQALRGLWMAGARGEARELAHQMLAEGALELPRNREEYFVSGAACWVLERHARADYDFERSRKSAEDGWYYADYLSS